MDDSSLSHSEKLQLDSRNIPLSTFVEKPIKNMAVGIENGVQKEEG